jgi:hypothetical protein
MTKDEMIEWFKSAPENSRHERMLWTARKVAHLTGVSEGRAYQMLLITLIEAEGPIRAPWRSVPPQQMADGSNIRHQWKLPKESD